MGRYRWPCDLCAYALRVTCDSWIVKRDSCLRRAKSLALPVPSRAGHRGDSCANYRSKRYAACNSQESTTGFYLAPLSTMSDSGVVHVLTFTNPTVGSGILTLPQNGRRGICAPPASDCCSYALRSCSGEASRHICWFCVNSPFD